MAYNPLYRGATSRAPSRGLSTGYLNGSISTIVKSAPVSVNAAGQIGLTNVSDETSVLGFVGVTSQSIPTGANGQVVSGGRAEAVDMPTFTLGDPVYVGKNGTLIKSKPDVGVADFTYGDFVIFVGVIVKNEFDPSKIDIQLMIEVIGQL